MREEAQLKDTEQAKNEHDTDSTLTNKIIDNSPHSTKAQKRQAFVVARKQQLEAQSLSYKCAKLAAKYLDDWYLDPILGFVFPSIGDAINAILTIPLVYLALVKLRSIPLTLAILNNLIKDCFIGLFPIVGDIVDAFYLMNKRNYRLVLGFIDDDQEIIKEVNRGAIYAAISIVVCAVLIYFTLKLLVYLTTEAFNLLEPYVSNFFGLFA